MTRLFEDRFSLGAPVDPIEHQAMQSTAARLAHRGASFTIRMAVAGIFPLGVKTGV